MPVNLETTDTDASQLIIRSELMETFAIANPLSKLTSVVVSGDGDGLASLFTVGGDGNIYNITPEPASSTGWGCRTLRAPVTMTQVAAGLTTTGNLVVVASDTSGDLYVNIDEPWSIGWVNAGHFPLPEEEISAIRLGFDDKNELIALVAGGGALYSLTIRDPEWGAQPILGGVGTIYDCQFGAARLVDRELAAPGVYISYATSGGGATNRLRFQPFAQSLPAQDQAVSARLDLLSVTSDPLGGSAVFATGTENNSATPCLFYLDARTNPQMPTLVTLSTGTTLTAIQASSYPVTSGSLDTGEAQPATLSNTAGLVELFAVDSTGNLLHLYRDPSAQEPTDGYPHADGWSPLVLLGDGFSNGPGALAVRKSADGSSEAFAIGANPLAPQEAMLFHFWQDLQTSDWKFMPMAVEYGGEVASVSTYSTQITVVDASNNPLPYQTLRIYASDGIGITVNSRSAFVDAVTPVECRTNAAGWVTVVSPTGNLGTPSLKVWAGFVPEGACITIRPDRYIQDQLYPDTEADLVTMLQGATVDGAPLVPADDVDAVASGVYSSMSLAQQAPESEDSQLTRVVSARGDRRGVRYMPRDTGEFPDRIHLPSVVSQHWSIDFRGEHPVFQRFGDREMAMEWAAQWSSSYPMLESSGSSWAPSWGSVMRSVKRGASTFTHALISTTDKIIEGGKKVVTAIEATIYLIVDSVTTAVKFTVGLIQQAFDLAQAIFEQVAAGFAKLFKWLGALFRWTDILQVQGMLNDYITQFYAYCQQGLQGAQSSVDKLFQQLQSQLSSMPSQTGAKGNTTMGTAKSDGEADAKAAGPSQNWFVSQIADGNTAASDATITVNSQTKEQAAGYAANIQSALPESTQDSLMTSFQSSLGQTQPSDATPNQMLSAASSALLTIAQSIVDGGFSLIETGITLIQDFMTAEWKMPLISKLYAKYVGQPMSLQGLICLMAAVPTTVAMKTMGFTLPPESESQAKVFRYVRPEHLFGGVPLDADTIATLRQRGAIAEDAEQLPMWVSWALGWSFTALNLVGTVLDIIVKYAKNLDKLSGFNTGVQLAALIVRCPAWGIYGQPIVTWTQIDFWSWVAEMVFRVPQLLLTSILGAAFGLLTKGVVGAAGIAGGLSGVDGPIDGALERIMAGMNQYRAQAGAVMDAIKRIGGGILKAILDTVLGVILVVCYICIAIWQALDDVEDNIIGPQATQNLLSALPLVFSWMQLGRLGGPWGKAADVVWSALYGFCGVSVTVFNGVRTELSYNTGQVMLNM